jgi:hypothetical protein
MGPDELGNGAATTQDRFAGQARGYRGARREAGEAAADPGVAPRNGAAPVLDQDSALDRKPTLPSLDLDGLAEPVFPPAAWLDVPAGTLADHPLLRGLLLELPPKGTVPAPDWLDRWFEAARAILELLYVDGIRRG